MSSSEEPAALAGAKRPHPDDTNPPVKQEVKSESTSQSGPVSDSDNSEDEAESADTKELAAESSSGQQSANSGADSGEIPTGDDSQGEEDNDDDQDDEEDEDEEEDDDVGVSRQAKRRRANQFLDIEAEVDDEEEDEMDEDDEEAELLREQFISDDHPEKDVALPGATDDRLHREYDQRRQKAEDQDAEQLAETLKQRYRKTHTVYRGDTAASGTVSQKLLMPSINDPAIFAIRCTPGREKDLVRKLYEKKRTLARQGKPLALLSVFQRDAFKGYIYIEAKKPEAIQQALTGMVNVYANQRIIVPVSEYPDLLKQVKSSDVEIVPGIYVRITRGKYKGDLAIVDNLSENGLEVRCKLVPRLDYGKNDDITPDGKRIRSKIRPIPRLFSEQEARTYDSDYLQPGRGPRSYVYRGEEFNEGFLYKDFKLQFIQTKDVHPSLEELDRFQTGATEEDGLDLAVVAASLKNSKSTDGSRSSAFQPGDNVEIRRGEQAKTTGRVTGVSLNEVTIIVTDAGDRQLVNQELTVTASDLRKVFSLGDHVKVVGGKHTDQTGLVIKIDGESVVLLSDQTKEDVRVFANYLIKATDSSTSVDMVNSKYEIKDLVQLNASTFGVIVKAETGFYGVLTSDGRVVDVKPTGIASKLKLSRREQVATDKDGSTINVGDSVKEAGGDKRKEGTILHIHKNVLFIESHELNENLGVFVTSALNVNTVSTKNSMISKTLGPDLSRMNPNLKLAPMAAPGSKMRSGGRDKLIYKDVVINSGNHKGLMGKVVETDDVDARIELHTKSKKVKVNKTKLSVLIRGESIPYLRFIGANDSGSRSASGPALSSAPAFSSGARSAWGGATPSVNGGAASSWGGKTPSAVGGGASTWGSSGGTSSWGSGGASTWGSSNGGGASSWGFGGNGGGGSAWGGNGNSGGGNSTWGSSATTGGNSTWGSNQKSGGNSTWGSNQKSGGSSAWGSSKGGSSAWGKSGRSSAWGNQTGGDSTWGSNSGGGDSSAWGSNSGESSGWRKSGGSSAWGNK